MNTLKKGCLAFLFCAVATQASAQDSARKAKSPAAASVQKEKIEALHRQNVAELEAALITGGIALTIGLGVIGLGVIGYGRVRLRSHRKDLKESMVEFDQRRATQKAQALQLKKQQEADARMQTAEEIFLPAQALVFKKRRSAVAKNVIA